MPLEIRELIIRVQVDESQGNGRQQLAGEQQLEQLKREIMEECMEKIKQELAKKKER